MVRLTIVDRSGAAHDVLARPGDTLMEAIRDSGLVEGDFALCGGACSCSTCHVYLSAEAQAVAAAMEPGERDLLEFAENRTEDSRLACQIRVAENLAGARVSVAPEE